VEAVADRLSPESFQADLKTLTDLPTRFSTSDGYARAAEFAGGQLAAAGYTVRNEPITVNGAPGSNVVADRRGAGPAPRGIVLVGAHLDSINLEGGPDSPAPGADDDGSGSAGVIEMARALKEFRGLHDLRFVLFGGEEQGLFGSRHHAARMTAAQRRSVRAVVHMDMIGRRNTPKPAVLLEGAPLSRAVVDGLAAAAAAYTRLTVQTSLNPFNSDHVSFIEKGVPAVLTIEGADDANDDVHTARDTLDGVDPDLALQILRMNTAFVVEQLGRA
jgi:Zn-dependent M28 family amino/carboxypeptidase